MAGNTQRNRFKQAQPGEVAPYNPGESLGYGRVLARPNIGQDQGQTWGGVPAVRPELMPEVPEQGYVPPPAPTPIPSARLDERAQQFAPRSGGGGKGGPNRQDDWAPVRHTLKPRSRYVDTPAQMAIHPLGYGGEEEHSYADEPIGRKAPLEIASPMPIRRGVSPRNAPRK